MGIAHIWALFKQRFSLPLCCLGVGLVSTWTELSYIHPPAGYLSVPYELFALFDTGTIAFALIIALTVRFAKTKQPLVSRTSNLVITALLLLSATTVNLLASVTGINAPALLDCFAVVAGGGLALLFVMWFEVISHLHPTQMLMCYSCAAVGRVCIIWLCGGLSPDRLWVCIFAITILAVLTLHHARCHIPETTPQPALATTSKSTSTPIAASAPEARCAFPLRPLLVVVSGTVALSFTLAAISNTWGINGNPGVLIASAGVVALILMKGEFFEFKWLWQGAVAFMAVSVTTFLLVDGLPSSFPGLLACVAYELCLMLMYSILSDLVYRSFYNPTFLFSVEIAVALSAGHIGDSLAAKCAGLVPGQSTLVLAAICAVLCGLFALACINAFAKQGPKDTWAALMRKPVAQDMDLLLEHSRLGLRCHDLAQEAGLSRREEEVLVLLAQKKKPSLIAKQLVIEVSTVNTHKKHLYQKLGVHSAKELQQRIGSVAED